MFFIIDSSPYVKYVRMHMRPRLVQMTPEFHNDTNNSKQACKEGARDLKNGPGLDGEGKEWHSLGTGTLEGELLLAIDLVGAHGHGASPCDGDNCMT